MNSEAPHEARMISAPVFHDTRGSLVPLEAGILPFKPARVFFIKDVPPGARRGGHETVCHQFLFATAGACAVIVDSGQGGRRHFTLEAWKEGLYVPRGKWVELEAFRDNAVIAVACSEHYKPRTDQRR
jgi:dTDP-4-dehydrorhamnose 3,5-epimerase-like enzyme